MSSSRTPFLTKRADGALLPVDLLQRIVENDHDLGGLMPASTKSVQKCVKPPARCLGNLYLPA